MVGGTYQNLAVGGGGLMPENINENESLKTSFKDSNTNDDEKTAAFSAVIEKFDVVTRKLTGRGISKREADHWNNFADLIILELEVAARRTNGISLVPAFLTEVLRRQFSLLVSKGLLSKQKKLKPILLAKPIRILTKSNRLMKRAGNWHSNIFGNLPRMTFCKISKNGTPKRIGNG
jgi:hypothetical protein